MQLHVFTEAMIALQALYGKQDSERLMALLSFIRNELSDNQMREAVCDIVKTFTPTTACPFPVPSHFMEVKNRPWRQTDTIDRRPMITEQLMDADSTSKMVEELSVKMGWK
jgi:hypothetical protein